MLRGIPSTIPPALLKILAEMGHGSEVVLADGNFPAVDYAEEKKIIRSDSLDLRTALTDILRLFPLDETAPNVVLMRSDDGLIPEIWRKYEKVLQEYPQARVEQIGRFDFYGRTRSACAVFITGERAPYANIILKKGTIHTTNE